MREIKKLRDEQAILDFFQPHLGPAAVPELLEQGAVSAKKTDNAADGKCDQQRVGFVDGFGALGVQAPECFRSRDAAGETQLFLVDHVALHWDGQEYAEGSGEKNIRNQDVPGLVGPLDEQQRAKRSGNSGSSRVTGG
jgi:hypothetical protein